MSQGCFSICRLHSHTEAWFWCQILGQVLDWVRSRPNLLRFSNSYDWLEQRQHFLGWTGKGANMLQQWIYLPCRSKEASNMRVPFHICCFLCRMTQCGNGLACVERSRITLGLSYLNLPRSPHSVFSCRKASHTDHNMQHGKSEVHWLLKLTAG